MKVADLVLRLQQLRPDAEVMAFDPDTGQQEPITGYVFDDLTVELHTDDMNAAVELGQVHHFGKPETRQLQAYLQQQWPSAIPAAVATLHAPNGIVHACEHHASTARLQASFLGSHAYVDEAPAGTPCTYCSTRLERGE